MGIYILSDGSAVYLPSDVYFLHGLLERNTKTTNQHSNVTCKNVLNLSIHMNIILNLITEFLTAEKCCRNKSCTCLKKFKRLLFDFAISINVVGELGGGEALARYI